MENEIFEEVLSLAIQSAGGKSEKAISRLLDLDTLKESNDLLFDIGTSLRELAADEETSILFDQRSNEPAPLKIGTGNPIGSFTGGTERDPITTLRSALEARYIKSQV